MTYEVHDPKKCDKCEARPAKHKVPFLYLDKQDKSHEDLGNCYRQYWVCSSCLKKMRR